MGYVTRKEWKSGPRYYAVYTDRAVRRRWEAVSKWESAVIVPRPEWLASFAKLYEIPVGYLVGVGEPYPTDKKKKNEKRG